MGLGVASRPKPGFLSPEGYFSPKLGGRPIYPQGLEPCNVMSFYFPSGPIFSPRLLGQKWLGANLELGDPQANQLKRQLRHCLMESVSYRVT